MAQENRTTLKTYFETGDTPTQAEFASSIDSSVNINEDIVNGTSKVTPIDADKLTLWDSVAGALKTLSWANLKATLKTYFDTIYGTLAATNLNTAKVSLDTDSVTVAKLATKFKGSSVISAVEIDWDLDQVRTKTITGNTIFTFANLYIGVKTLQITGSFTIAFPTGFDLMDGSQAYDGTKVNWIDVICSDTGTPLGMVNIYFKA